MAASDRNTATQSPGRVHVIGVGGSGMNALARYLVEAGWSVSGSDLVGTEVTAQLAELGIDVGVGHDARRVAGCQTVVSSEAIGAANVELTAARASGIETLRRAQFLGRISETRTAVCIAGAHGKTSTAALVARILETCGHAPSYIIGAPSPGLSGGNAKASTGPHIVLECCEAFRGLVWYAPDIAVITNIDNDHLEHYGSQDAIDDAFLAFAERTPASGTVIVNADDAGVNRILRKFSRTPLTFGISAKADVRAKGLERTASGTEFDLVVHGKAVGRLKTSGPGDYLVENLLAASAAGFALGLSADQIITATEDAPRPARRWQDHGLVAGVHIIDDFAHHPSELRACEDASRQISARGGRRVIAFQPQTPERIRRLAKDFAEALAGFDAVFLLDPAGGSAVSTGANRIARELDDIGTACVPCSSVAGMVTSLSAFLQAGDTAILAGGGTIGVAVQPLIAALQMVGIHHAAAISLKEAGGNLHQTNTADGSGLLQRLNRQAEEAPGAPALSCGECGLTHGELARVTDQLANAFAALGISRGETVALGLPPSIDLVCCQIAALKLGAAYLCLDDQLPSERLGYMMESAGVRLLVTSRLSPMFVAAGHIRTEHIEAVVAKSGKAEGLLREPAPPDREVATICYTSGSTGRPKGVTITHAALEALFADAIPRFGLDAKSRTVLNTSTNFDVSIAEIMMTLCAGGAVVIPEARRTLLGQELGRLIEKSRVTHLFATPTVLETLPTPGSAYPFTIVAAGEICPAALADRLGPGRTFINCYGPAEATIYATACKWVAGNEISIGKPLSHVDLMLLDGEGRPVAKGQPGEICLSGIAVCAGYLGETEAYADRFRIGSDGRQHYRTGDLAHQRPDGALEFLGRLDQQIKIRGNRIELAEIEATVKGAPGVTDAVACVEEAASGPQIVVYFTHTEEAGEPDVLAAVVGAWLPAYMIASNFVPVGDIPRTVTGKRDRRETSRRYRHRIARPSRYAAPETASEEVLARLWRKVLEVEAPVGRDDSFDALGGDSLKQMLLVLEIESHFGIRIPPGWFGRITTISAMMPRLDSVRDAGTEPSRQDDGQVTQIYGKIRELTANWQGDRRDNTALIVSAGNRQSAHHLFWCLQNGAELDSLAATVGRDIRIHGMRSGHRVFEYTPETVAYLSAHYAREALALVPDGQLFLGGNCQGGQIAHAMAQRLKAAGRTVRKLILLEQAHFPEYGDEICFIYGEQGSLNPFRRFGDDLAQYRQSYPQGFAMHVMPGEHGTYFNATNVHFLAGIVRSAILEDN